MLRPSQGTFHDKDEDEIREVRLLLRHPKTLSRNRVLPVIDKSNDFQYHQYLVTTAFSVKLGLMRQGMIMSQWENCYYIHNI